MLHVVMATANRHKYRELKALLATAGIRWHSLAEFPDIPPLHEHGVTFDANAAQKAVQAARATGLFALADDSGLEVDALGGAPGVRSARFAGSHGDDRANNEKLLRLLEGVPAAKRRARYRCSLVLASRSGVVAITRGTWAGRITTAPKGRGGFGYDPIVLIPRWRKTVAQVPPSWKARWSHRAAAAKRMRVVLKRLVGRTVSARRRTSSPASRPGRAPVA